MLPLIDGGKTLDVRPIANLVDYPRDQRSYETAGAVDVKSFGPTTRGPLGWVVGGRSGDKASDANVGLYVRNDDKWDWLRSLLTVGKIKYLLDEEYKGGVIERFEIPGIRAGEFVLLMLFLPFPFHLAPFPYPSPVHIAPSHFPAFSFSSFLFGPCIWVSPSLFFIFGSRTFPIFSS